jgi:hypothetical protein
MAAPDMAAPDMAASAMAASGMPCPPSSGIARLLPCA